MKLERLAVQRYGPLEGFDERLADGVQLVHGPNESGKTLLVEALLELLTGAAVGDRVTEPVRGFADVRVGGERLTADGDATLVAHLDGAAGATGGGGGDGPPRPAVTPAGFRNVFVIRDADLAVDSGYYETVTAALTGLRTGDIRRLQEAVRERGRLTPQRLDLSGASEHGDPAGQRAAAAALRDDVDDYLREAETAAVGTAERELFEARRRVETLETAVAELEAARERRTLAGLRETVEQLRTALDERQRLPDPAALADLRRDLADLADRAGAAPALERRLSLYRPVALAGLALAVLGAAGLLVADPGPAGVLVPALGVAVAAVGAYRWGRADRSLAGLTAERAALHERARAAGIEVDAAGRQDDDVEAAAPRAVGLLRGAVDDLAARHGELDSAVDRAVGRLVGELSLDVAGDDPTAVADAAAARLAARERHLPDVDRAFEEGALEAHRDELADARERAETLADELSAHRRALDDFERRAADLAFERFTGEPLDLALAGVEGLERLRERCDELVAAVERDAAVARTAHEVLAAMAADEDEKIAALFGPESRASELLRAVTDGRYDAVRFDADRGAVVVDGGAGALAPAALSHGARDQLFFCVRVGLAEQLLGGETGFLVLDDAFLASDPDRLDRQVAVLDRLAAAGWQVLYLTAQADAVDRLRERCPDPIELPRARK